MKNKITIEAKISKPPFYKEGVSKTGKAWKLLSLKLKHTQEEEFEGQSTSIMSISAICFGDIATQNKDLSENEIITIQGRIEDNIWTKKDKETGKETKIFDKQIKIHKIERQKTDKKKIESIPADSLPF